MPYESAPNGFAVTGGINHSTLVSGLINGSQYSWYVRCQDAAGNSNPDDFPIVFGVANSPQPDNVTPGVAMTSPSAGAVSGNVVVAASASDNVGVMGVQFLLNGVALGADDVTAPYSVTWTSTAVPNGGPYALSARARDAAGNVATAPAVSVTVNNTSLASWQPTTSTREQDRRSSIALAKDARVRWPAGQRNANSAARCGSTV